MNLLEEIIAARQVRMMFGEPPEILEPQPGEKVIDRVPDELTVLGWLYCESLLLYERALMEAANIRHAHLQSVCAHSAKLLDEAQQKRSIAIEMRDMFNLLFWRSLRRTLPNLPDPCSLEIRKGGKIVVKRT